METVRVVASRRHETGKGMGRRLRRAGQVPAVLYGNGAPVALALDVLDLIRIQKSEAGENTIVDLNVSGDGAEICNAILREVQIDPVSRAPLHADLYRVQMNKPLMVSVPLEFINEPDEQLKVADAHLHIIMREVEVECLPQDIPDSITVDLETFQVGEVLKAGELVLPAGVTLVTDAEEAVVAATIQGAEAEQGADEVEETETPAD